MGHCDAGTHDGTELGQESVVLPAADASVLSSQSGTSFVAGTLHRLYIARVCVCATVYRGQSLHMTGRLPLPLSYLMHADRDHYKMRLKYPELPCAIAGSSKKPEWIPVEVCRVITDSEWMPLCARVQLVSMRGRSAPYTRMLELT